MSPFYYSPSNSLQYSLHMYCQIASKWLKVVVLHLYRSWNRTLRGRGKFWNCVNWIYAFVSLKFQTQSLRLSDLHRKSQLWRGIVSVTLIEGRELKAMDANGLSDPYVKFRLGHQKYKSKVILAVTGKFFLNALFLFGVFSLYDFQ